MKLAGVFVLLAALLGVPAQQAQAVERIALIIGNSEYRNTTTLKNPLNDANAVANKLTKLGFKVLKGLDADKFAMNALIRTFGREMQNADMALFYYAGHGLRIAGRNYLVPIDAALKEEADVDFEAVDLQLILKQMERRQRTSIVLLDACRDNPLSTQLARSMGTRSAFVGRGLARIETGVGTFIGFSTQPGNVAQDGSGLNSPFTGALLKNLDEPGLDIEVLMRRVREQVVKETDGKQVPWSNSSLVGDSVILNAASPATPPPVKQAAVPAIPAQPGNLLKQPPAKDESEVAFELAFWRSIENSKNPAMFEAYLKRYPNGNFSILARARISELTSSTSGPAPEPIGKPDRDAGTQLASKGTQPTARPSPEPAPPQDEPAPPPGLSERELTLAIQQELGRIGCSPGRPDGIWGRNSRRAVQSYARHSGAQLASLEPTPELLDLLKPHKARVCPLGCPRGQVLTSRGTCLAKRPAPAIKRRTTRTRTRARRSKPVVRHRAPQRRQNKKTQGWSADPNCPQCSTF